MYFGGLHCFLDETACGMLPLVNARVSSTESTAPIISASGWHKAWRVAQRLRIPAAGSVFPKLDVGSRGREG